MATISPNYPELRAPSNNQNRQKPFRADRRLKLAFSALMVLTFMVAMNSTALAVAIPAVAADLDGTALESFWAATAFLLTEAVFMVPMGRTSDVVGRLPVLNFSTGLFLVGTMISSVSPSMAVLIFGRAVQGAGSGGVAVLLEIIVTDLVPLHVRGNYFSLISALWTFGDVVGPILGGLVTWRASWRWIFWCNIPFTITGVILNNMFVPLRPVPGSYWQKARQIDWVGMAISIAAFSSLLLGITWGGVLYAWNSPSTIVPITIGLLGIGVFVIYEKCMAPKPLLRFELLGNYTITYALFAAFFHAVMVLGLIYILPLYFEAVQQASPFQASLYIIPYGITLAPFSGIAGIIISRTGNIRWVIRAGYVLAVLGSGLLILLNAQTPFWQSALIIACAGAGLGLLYNALLLLVQMVISEEHAVLAVTVLNFCRYLGQAAGVAIVGVVFQNRMSVAMLSDSQIAPYADEYASDAAGLVDKIKALRQGQFKEKIISAYSVSLRAVWICMCAFCILPLVGSFFLPDLGKRKHQKAAGELNQNTGRLGRLEPEVK